MNTWSLIQSDLERICEKATLSSFLRWYLLPQSSTFPHDVWFRILQSCKRSAIMKYTIGLYAYFRERHFALKYGIHINSNIHVGKGLHIVHGGGIYLNTSFIGDYFTCFQSVTLGTNKNGIPKVKDNVTIYPGAVVVGDITLSDGCSIGANSYVDKDVAENHIVCGIPGKDLRIKE